MEDTVSQQVQTTVNEMNSKLRDQLFNFFSSKGTGGQEIVDAFMEEFTKLEDRSPKDDPTNIRNYLGILREHIETTLDNSITVDTNGSVNISIAKDSFLGFDLDRSKLKHKPLPVAWVVYLIRGIAGPFAFVSNQTYFKKYGRPMPPQYAGGFLIGKGSWNREGWDKAVGDFSSYKHPASGASPIPFLRNVIARIDMQELVKRFFERYGYDTSDA